LDRCAGEVLGKRVAAAAVMITISSVTGLLPGVDTNPALVLLPGFDV
jgi:hypothetical protein